MLRKNTLGANFASASELYPRFYYPMYLSIFHKKGWTQNSIYIPSIKHRKRLGGWGVNTYNLAKRNLNLCKGVY